MNLADDVLEAVRGHLALDVPHYSDSLRAAFEATDPVFGRPRYSEFFWHCASTVPGWLAEVTLANAAAESHGSLKLFQLWQTVNYNAELEKLVLVHAKDESRHSRLFVDLVELAFPRSSVPAVLARLRETLPDVRRAEPIKQIKLTSEEILIDHLVQMNIGEIRTREHMNLLAPAIHAFAPTENRAQVRKILEGLARDEVRHIAYTAELMERWCTDGQSARVAALYRQRLHDFNVITVQQTEGAIRDFGHGRFPDLLEL